MKTLSLVLVLGLFTGCASLPSTVHEEIQGGDPQAKVIALLGQPDSFHPGKMGGEVWFYHQGSEACSFLIKKERVAVVTCRTHHSGNGHSGATNAAVIGLYSAGQGLGRGLQRPVPTNSSCSTYVDPVGVAHTQCQ